MGQQAQSLDDDDDDKLKQISGNVCSSLEYIHCPNAFFAILCHWP
jgi:hypothetical protein